MSDADSGRCRLCGGADHRPYLERVYALGARTFDLVRCAGCGLVFVRPFPEVEELRALYTESYFHADFSCGIRSGSYLETERSRVEEYREILAAISARKPAGRLLEVGCAAGSFLHYAQRAGYAVTGVDVSAWAVAAAREQFGLDVRRGRLTEVAFPEKSFDVIFLGDVLEHEPEPLPFLGEVARLLHDDGVAVIKVPTYVNSFYYRLFRRLPWQWTLGKLDLRLLHALKLHPAGASLPPYHLFEFSPPTLSRLCAAAGLRVVGRKNSLLVPEFLAFGAGTLSDAVILAGFRTLKLLVKTFNLHGGHVMVFAVKEAA